MTKPVRLRFARPIYFLVPVVLLSLSPSLAQAQELIADGPELGWIGLGGMIACAIGIVFGILNRRSISLHEKAERLESEVEQRDDKIWALQERLAHLTALVDGQDDLVGNTGVPSRPPTFKVMPAMSAPGTAARLSSSCSRTAPCAS